MFSKTPPRQHWPLVARAVALCGILLLALAAVAAEPARPGRAGAVAAPPAVARTPLARYADATQPNHRLPATDGRTLVAHDEPGPLSGTTSQQFEPLFEAYTAEAAVLFTATGITGESWAIDQITALGSYFNGPGPAASVTVRFYGDIGLPDPLLVTRANLPYDNGSTYGDLIIPLEPAVVLPAGQHYWVSVQANMNLGDAGQWFWQNAGLYSQTYAAWRNPGNGFRLGCPIWQYRANCDLTFDVTNQAYAMSGAVVGTPTPTPTGTLPTATPTRTARPAPPTVTGTVVLPLPLATQPTGVLSPTAVPACGLAWRDMPAPNANLQTNILRSVAVIGPNELWAVGSTGAPGSAEETLIQRWDGTAWTRVPSPNPGPSGNLLLGVAVVSHDEAWAVGYTLDGTVQSTLILHWNGTAWTRINSPNVGPNSNALRGVVVISPTDAWAVGYSSQTGDFGSEQTLTLHWDGTRWNVVPSANNGTYSNVLYSVTATSRTDVWATGRYYPGSGGGNYTLMLHWNGTAWAVVTAPVVGSCGNYPFAIKARTPDDVWMVGYSYSDAFCSWQEPLVMHWNGSAWTTVPAFAYPSANTLLLDLVVVGPNDVWAVGYHTGNNLRAYTLVEHWNGATWTPVDSPEPAGLNSHLLGVTAVSNNELWAVGYYAASASRAMTQHYTDPCVTPSPTPSATPSATPSPSRTAPNTATVTRTPTATTTASPTPCTLGFSDVQPSDYFYTQVRALACRGVISGYSDGTFRPYTNTTRGQMVKIVVLGFGVPITTPPGNGYTFADVLPGSAFFPYVETAAARGIVSGYTCGGPNEPCD
ncbi:MAG TPA: S-layer homology domain-containing protein, partial [Chloroflexia bacterium]|nr:S-layer homology domain-containing protein [Chloroflexia bacterium]